MGYKGPRAVGVEKAAVTIENSIRDLVKQVREFGLQL